MKNLSLIFFIVITTSFAPNTKIDLYGKSTTSSIRFDKLKDVYYEISNCYDGIDKDGNTLTMEQRLEKTSKAIKTMNSFDSGARESYSIYFNLINHMVNALNDNPSKACNDLQEASKEFERINNAGYMYKRDVLTSYKKNLSITPSVLNKLYLSEYCTNYGITENFNCTTLPGWEDETEDEDNDKDNGGAHNNGDEKEDENKESNQEEGNEITYDTLNTTSSKNSSLKIKNSSGATIEITPGNARFVYPDNRVYESDDAIHLILDLIDKGALNTEHFEIERVVVGDSRWVNAFKGTPFEIKIKDNAKSVLKFPVGEYVVNDGSEKAFWQAYKTGLRDFHGTVLFLMEVFGAKAYNILIQGSADALKFKQPKPLLPSLNTKFFHEVIVLELAQDGQSIVEDTIHIGETYDNLDLPQLRGAYMKFALSNLSRIKNFPNKLHILKGKVTKDISPDDRNCTILIYIDEDKALEYARRVSDKIKEYPEIKLWDSSK